MVDKEMLAAMEELLDRKLDEKLDQKFDEKLKPINQKLDKLDNRILRVETSVKNLKDGMEKLDERTSRLETSVENLKDGMEKLDKRTSRLETSVEKMEEDMTYVKVVQLENNVIPRLNTIEKCYVDTSRRYLEQTERIDRMDADISILKQVVTNHSEQLKKAQ